MMLHAASIVACFADQATQTPVIVQFAQVPPDPQWKWWLKLLAEVLGPLLSTAGSIYVAWRVFRWQGEKDRNKWLLDQKMAEWKGLIELTAEYEQIMPLGEPGSATVDGVRFKVLPLCGRISHLVSQALFVAPVLSAHEIQPKLSQIMIETDRAIGRIEIFDQSSQKDKMALGTPATNATAIRGLLERLHAKIVSLAQADLFLA